MEHFSQLVEQLSAQPQKRRVGVVAAADEHTLQAIWQATEQGLVQPVLFGDIQRVALLWGKIAPCVPLPQTVHCEDDKAAAEEAVAWVRAGKLDCLMKGGLETAILLRAVLNSETGIRKRDFMSTVGIIESPYYHKLFAVTDPALATYPDLAQKKALIENAVDVLHALGVAQPKVACLAPIETVNPKMPVTVDAAALKQMGMDGELTGCIVEGPISYDLAMDPDAAAIKGYESPVAGDADVLLVPNIESGNILAKCLSCTGNAKSGGIVCGAQVPIILVSRSFSAQDKFYSIVLAALVGNSG